MEIISKKDAKAKGLTHYFTGKACCSGHITTRYVSCGRCCECDADRQRAARKAKPEYYRGLEVARRGTRKDYTKARYAENREQSIASVLTWRDLNRERHNTTRRAYQKRRLVEDPVFALELRVRNSINDALGSMGYTKRSRAAAILGCTWLEFKAHIERQFLKGMDWGNRSLWHIDHITPIAAAVTESDVLALSHFTNLRPLWATENLEKKDKIMFLI